MTTPQPAALPEHTIGKHDHPEPHTMCWSDLELGAIKRYAESYALAALQSQPAAAGVSDADLLVVAEFVGLIGPGSRLRAHDAAVRFARAILALRPQAVPMTDEQAAALIDDLSSWADYVDVDHAFETLETHVRQTLAAHGITTQGAQGGEAK